MTSDGFHARFFDGRSARPRAALVGVEGQSLRVTLAPEADGERETVLLWPAGNVKLVDPADHGPSRTFTNLMLPLSRLVMASPDDARVLTEALSIVHDDAARLNIHARGIKIWGALAVAVVLFFLYGIPMLSATLAPLVPYEQRYEFGRYVVRALAGNQDRCIGYGGRRALNVITGRLIAASGHREKVRVEVTESEDVNAFAAPGGSIVVFKGLIDAAESPEELAGVLGHELGHVMKEHPMEATMRAFGFALALGVMFGGADAGMASTAVMVHSLSYNRRAEREADEIAAGLLEKINVDPIAIKTFFTRMQKENGDDLEGALGYFSTHPSWPDRIAAMDAHAAPANVLPVLDAQAWSDLKAICAYKPPPPADDQQSEESADESDDPSESEDSEESEE